MLGGLALLALRYYSNHIDTESQQPQQYGSCAQERKGNTERCKSQVPGGTQRALGPKGSKGPRQSKRAAVDTNTNPESYMYANQYEEHLAHSAPCASRWDGFDRGDADWDYDEERRAQNEADEAELRAEGLL